MSHIPDCRTDENYNQKYLNSKDKEFVDGFDWAIEMAVDNFFDNLDNLEDGFIKHILGGKVDYGDEYTMEFKFGEREPEDRTVENYADYLRAEMLKWCESQRDELITSMIDNMDDEEYAANKVKVDGQSEAENQ